MNNDDKILTYKILGVHVHLSKCWKGTDLSAEILKGYMLICWNAEGVHDKQKVGHPWGKQILSSRSLCSIYCLVKITRGKVSINFTGDKGFHILLLVSDGMLFNI